MQLVDALFLLTERDQWIQAWQCCFHRGTYARIAPQSGWAYWHFIDVGVGVVDLDFRGEIKVILFNQSVEDFPVQAGDRIA